MLIVGRVGGNIVVVGLEEEGRGELVVALFDGYFPFVVDLL